MLCIRLQVTWAAKASRWPGPQGAVVQTRGRAAVLMKDRDRLLIASSLYAKGAGLIPGQGTYKKQPMNA